MVPVHLDSTLYGHWSLMKVLSLSDESINNNLNSAFRIFRALRALYNTICLCSAILTSTHPMKQPLGILDFSILPKVTLTCSLRQGWTNDYPIRWWLALPPQSHLPNGTKLKLSVSRYIFFLSTSIFFQLSPRRSESLRRPASFYQLLCLFVWPLLSTQLVLFCPF